MQDRTKAVRSSHILHNHTGCVTGPANEYANSIVLTTIQYPTPSVIKLAELPSWKLIVVGDLKTPADWFLQGVDFLSYEMQLTLSYEILKTNLTPVNSYA